MAEDEEETLHEAVASFRRDHPEKPTMKFRPHHDRVLIRPDKDEDTKGDFILLAQDIEKSRTGEIVAVGPGIPMQNIKLDIAGDATPEVLDRVEALIQLIKTPVAVINKPGDRVIFGQYSGTRIRINGDEYLMIRETDIMGTL